MILDVRHSNFVFLFPPNFFADEIKEKYKPYYKNLLLPYDTIDDFMSSTVQSIEFPGWDMKLEQQTRIRGKLQEYKSASPIEDYFKRDITVTFKMSDAFINYFIFLDNALNFLNFDNPKQTLEPMRLLLLNNEGYSVASVVFDRPILYGQDGINLSYNLVQPNFNTFTAKFKYFQLEIKPDFGN